MPRVAYYNLGHNNNLCHNNNVGHNYMGLNDFLKNCSKINNLAYVNTFFVFLFLYIDLYHTFYIIDILEKFH